jgi:hypothetical protein
MGRPRKPTAILRLNGALERNPGRHANRAGEPRVTDPLGPPREAMSAEAKVIWMEIERLAPWLVSADRLFVEIAAQLMATFRSYGGLGTASVLGRLESILARLGMSPADRSKLNIIPTPTGPNEYDQLGPPNKFANNGEFANNGPRGRSRKGT